MKKKQSPVVIIGPLVVVAVMIFMIYQCNSERFAKREKLEGIWLVDDLNEPLIVTQSNLSGYKTGSYTHIRVIDPHNGKILHDQSFSADSWSGDDLKCMTATSMWIDRKDDWICLDFPTLKKRWTQKTFFKFLKKTHPEMGDPYSMKLIGTQFQITNKEGKNHFIGMGDLEPNSPHPTYYFLFHQLNQLGYSVRYTTPETRFMQQEKITIEVENLDEGNQRKKYHWERMNIREKLQADTGFAKNYAVFSPDSGCYFFDGNKSRIAYKLVNDSLELKWAPMFDSREWLEADFLRPYKAYNYLPDNRLITTQKNRGFISYWTSLDEKENKIKLAGVDLNTDKIIWDIDLTANHVKHGYKPEQTTVLDDLLIIVWKDNAGHGTIMGIHIDSGEVKWVVRK